MNSTMSTLAISLHASLDFWYYFWLYYGAFVYNMRRCWNYFLWQYAKKWIDYPLLGWAATVLLFAGLLYLVQRSEIVRWCVFKVVGNYVRMFTLM